MQVRTSRLEQSITARQLRSSIKSTVAQLDAWEGDQKTLKARRILANHQAGGSIARKQIALSRAKASLGTQDLRDPPCDRCDSIHHLTGECDQVDTGLNETVSDQHQPRETATDIHRSIIDRLYKTVCDLYQFSYPSAYSLQSDRGLIVSEVVEVFPEAPVLLNYQDSAIFEAATDLWQLRPSILTDQDKNKVTGNICRLYYSKAFQIDFIAFYDKVLETLEEFDEEG